MEAFRQGGRGPAWEAGLLSRPWGFPIEQITVDAVHVWQGALDQNVSIETGAAMARAVPHAHTHFHADEGHISVAVNDATAAGRLAELMTAHQRHTPPRARGRRRSDRS